jgi:hypothetical protein
MKLRIATFAFMFLTLAPAFATQTGTSDQTEEFRERLQEIRERLALAPDQEERVRPVLMEEMQKLKALREKYGNESQNRRTTVKMARELKEIRSAADDQLKQILTKRQMDELKKIREERRDELKSRSGR